MSDMVGKHEDTFSHYAPVTVFRQELLDVLYITAFPTRTTGCVVYYSVSHKNYWMCCILQCYHKNYLICCILQCFPQELLDVLYITVLPTRTTGCVVYYSVTHKNYWMCCILQCYPQELLDVLYITVLPTRST